MEKNDKKEELKVIFPSNSKITKGEDGKKVEKIVTGKIKQQKPGFGRRLTETFLEDDTRSVGNYIINDVLIPAAKNLICDVVGWGGFAEILLFGDKRGGARSRGGRSSNSRSYTSYGSYYRSSDRDSRDRGDRRDISKTGRARHDFDEIIIETRGEAEEVLAHLVDLTVDYDQATVADFYDLVGVNSSFTDNKYGWTDLSRVNVTRVRDGYIINLPRTKILD